MQVRLYLSLIVIVQWALLLVSSGLFSENPWPDRVRWIGLFGLCVVMFNKQAARVRNLSAVDFFVGMFLLVALTSLVETPYRQTALLRTLSVLLLYIAVFWSLWKFADQGGEEAILRAFNWSLGLCLLGGLLMGATGLIGAWQADGRFRGLTGNPNSVGLLGAMAMPLLITQVIERRQKIDILFVLAAATSVLLSGSRTAAVSCAIATSFLLARAGMGRGLAVLLVGGLLFAALLNIRPWEQSAGYTGTSHFDNPLTRLSFREDTLMGGGRFEVWPIAVDAIKEAPMMGHGFGTEEFWLDEAGIDESRLGFHQGKYMHNSYLGLVYQVGFVGAVILFIPLFGLASQATLLLLQRRLKVRQAGYVAVLLTGLAAASAESWIYAVGNPFCFPFWTVVMLLIRSLANEQRQSKTMPRLVTHARESAQC